MTTPRGFVTFQSHDGEKPLALHARDIVGVRKVSDEVCAITTAGGHEHIVRNTYESIMAELGQRTL